MPRKNTPPPEKSKAKHHLLPWRVCLTDSEKSEIAKSEIAERQDEIEAAERTKRKWRELEERLIREEQERI